MIHQSFPQPNNRSYGIVIIITLMIHRDKKILLSPNPSADNTILAIFNLNNKNVHSTLLASTTTIISVHSFPDY